MEKQLNHKSKILIVDDDPVNRKLITAMLPSDTYNIFEAKNGNAALSTAFQEIPDLILLDVVMPDIDGFEVTRRIKKHSKTKDIPIVLITALDGSENRRLGLEAGAEELLNKPVHSVELRARIRSMLKLRAYRDQLSIRVQSEQNLSEISNIPLERFEPQEKLPLVLLVEDNEVDALIVRKSLSDLPCRLKTLDSGSEVLNWVREEPTDLILLDILLPGIDGFEICRCLKDENKDIQIVIVTCLDDLDSKIKGVELGADDFLVKPIVGRELKSRVKILLEKKGDLDRLRSQYAVALDSAVLDWLTGLYNHGYLQRFLGYELLRAAQQGFPVSLIMIDVDDFKTYNDTLGHSAGDAILREIGRTVRNVVREVDLAARYGGEEFALVLPYADREVAVTIAERVKKTITSHDFFHDASPQPAGLTVSMGIAVFPEQASNKEDLLKLADRMLYKAKRGGKNRFCVMDGEK